MRGKYTLVTSGRLAARLMLEPVNAEAKYCIGSTPAMTSTWIRHASRREVREAAEDDDVDRGREDRDEDRPRNAEERLLVADHDVAPDQRREQLAEVPELRHVEVRPPGSGTDDAHAAETGGFVRLRELARRAVRGVVPAGSLLERAPSVAHAADGSGDGGSSWSGAGRPRSPASAPSAVTMNSG